MLPFLGKDEANLRRLESQLQQRECQITNLESSLAKSKADAEKLKADVDQLRTSLREATAKNLQQEQQLERYNKELKPKKEMCAWLQERVSYLKKELESRSSNEKDVMHKVHQKTEETERLRGELQATKKELELVKAALQTTDLHASRFRNEAQSEIERLQNEVHSKTQAMQLLEDSLSGRELTEEQKEQLQKAACFDQVTEDLKRCKEDLRALQAKHQEMEVQMREAEFAKGELNKAQEEKQQVSEECKRLGAQLDAMRSSSEKTKELEAQNAQMAEALKRSEQQWEMQNHELKELKLQLEEKDMKGDAFQASADKFHGELQRKEQELSGLRAHCDRLQEENNKLYEHVTYVQEQLDKAKDVIEAKQGILENERAVNDSDKRSKDSTGQLMQSLRSELASCRIQIAELTTKDKKAADAIQALERKMEQLKGENTQVQQQNQSLDKELKAAQVEILRVQQQLNAATEKLGMYKNRISSLKDEISENEKGTWQDQGSNVGRLPKCPEYYALQERVRMLEEEIIAERSSHSVTKNMLKQESEHRATQTGTTHVSTPFPHPGSSFRFSYCRGDQAHVMQDTPQLTFSNNGTASHQTDAPPCANKTPNKSDATPIVEEEPRTSEATLSSMLRTGQEQQPKPEVDDGAMDVDDAEQLRASVRFLTPGPKFFASHEQKENHNGDGPGSQSAIASHRRVTLDFHQLSTQAFNEYTQQRERCQK